MSRARRSLVALGLHLLRVTRRLVRPVVVVAGLWLVSGLVGRWMTTVLLTVAVLALGLRGWVRMERRLDARARRARDDGAFIVRHRVMSPGGTAAAADEHVAFAWALAVVSAHYLAHCEDQADVHARARMEGWR